MDKKVFQPRLECSTLLGEVITALRGQIEEDAFLSEALTVGIAKKIEEMLQHQQQSIFNRVVVNTDEFRSALPLFQIKPAAPPSNVTPFGHDVTRPKTVS